MQVFFLCRSSVPLPVRLNSMSSCAWIWGSEIIHSQKKIEISEKFGFVSKFVNWVAGSARTQPGSM